MATQRLSGKVCIVTGGGRGLGRAMVLGLARAGVKVVATAARTLKELESVVDEAGEERVLPLIADVTAQEDCERVIKATYARFGGLHILVNNAGRGMRYVSEKFLDQPSRFWEADPEIWKMIIDTNVNGPFYMTRAALPVMLAQHWGRIINIFMNHARFKCENGLLRLNFVFLSVFPESFDQGKHPLCPNQTDLVKTDRSQAFCDLFIRIGVPSPGSG